MIIHKAKYDNKTEQSKFVLLAIVTLAVSVLEIVSLGFFTSDLRGDLLFSDFMDPEN